MKRMLFGLSSAVAFLAVAAAGDQAKALSPLNSSGLAVHIDTAFSSGEDRLVGLG